MLKFVSPRLALSYLLLCTLSCIGVLQIQAAHQRLRGLSLWSGRGKSWWGYTVGSLLIVGSFSSFYAFTPGLLVPGLAGSELVILFAAGCILALTITLTASSLAAPRPSEAMREAEEGEAVVTPQLQGQLYVPQGSGPFPALCLIPEIGSPAGNLSMLASHLQTLGFVVLSIDWMAASGPSHYPDMLALVPTGVNYLLRRREVNRERIGVIGFGLGGDLALRAAGPDGKIAAAVAASPCLALEPCETDLELLRQGSLWQAVQWRRRQRARGLLARQFDGLASLPQIPPRPLLILYPPQHSPPDLPNGVEAHPLPDAQTDPSRNQEVTQMIGHWCEEHL